MPTWSSRDTQGRAEAALGRVPAIPDLAAQGASRKTGDGGVLTDVHSDIRGIEGRMCRIVRVSEEAGCTHHAETSGMAGQDTATPGIEFFLGRNTVLSAELDQKG